MPNFRDAALRHIDDCHWLWSDVNVNRADNASQLAAYGAECLLKGILQKAGILTLDTYGKPKVPFNVHLNQGPSKDLVALYNATQSGVSALPVLGASQFFSGWTINNRYDGTLFSSAVSTQHHADAKAFENVLVQALLKGQI